MAVYWTSPCKFKSILVLRSTFKYFFTLSVSIYRLETYLQLTRSFIRWGISWTKNSGPWNLFLFCFFCTENKESQLIKLSCSTAKYTYSTRCQHLQGGQQHQQVVWQQQGGGGHYGRGWLQGGGQGQKVADKAKVVNNTKVVKNAKVFNNRVVDITSRWQWSPARWITRNLKYWVKQARRTQRWAKGSKSQPN